MPPIRKTLCNRITQGISNIGVELGFYWLRFWFSCVGLLNHSWICDTIDVRLEEEVCIPSHPVGQTDDVDTELWELLLRMWCKKVTPLTCTGTNDWCHSRSCWGVTCPCIYTLNYFVLLGAFSFIFCVWLFHLYIFLYTTHVKCPWRPVEGVRYPWTRVTDVCECHVGSGYQTKVL